MSLDGGLVFIVIVNWNGWHDTLECVKSCRSLDYRPFHLLVVDNGSTDDSAEKLHELLPNVEILETGENLGFAGGNNAGIERALEQGAEHVWLLNNDTVVEAETLSALVRPLQHNATIGMTTSKIYFFDRLDTIWFAGGTISRKWGFTRHVGEGEADRGQYDRPSDVDYGSGASLLVRASVVSEIGPLDPDYFVYWEETDWCERARRAGWRVRYVPASRVWHKVGAATPPEQSWAKWRYEGRNRVMFYKRNRPGEARRVALLALLNAAYLLFRGRPRSAAALVRGVGDACAGRTGRIPDARRDRDA